jgi:hypothetical protein
MCKRHIAALAHLPHLAVSVQAAANGKIKT